MVLVGSRGRVPGVTPFLSVAQKDHREDLGTARKATELCGRDFFSLVLNVSNSNELQGIDHSEP